MRVYHLPSRQLIASETTAEFLETNSVGRVVSPDRLDWPNFPPSFSLKSIMTPARDQGVAGSCCHFGCVSCLEPLFGRQTDLSEGHLQDFVARRWGHNCQFGAAIGECMVVLKDVGIVAEKAWGYDESQCCWNNSPNIVGVARYKFTQIGYGWRIPTAKIISMMKNQLDNPFPDFQDANPGTGVPDGSSPDGSMTEGATGLAVKTLLTSNSVPIAVDVPVWWRQDGYLQANWEWGPDIVMPTPSDIETWLINPTGSLNESGWHVIAICGYDDTTQRYEFKNSWGKWWGSDGFGTIPYSYLNKYSRVGMVGVL